ncbi:MAG: LLM class flavin-dependent oxidoreductase [Xanthobacteraceae bacterium]|nr:LLM class flavin-dependent oxidoreductase [Xanthobacteraceae bacterium]
MKFGLFDHVDRNDRPLATQFDERLRFIAAADEAGFFCYHVAEHHASPLNTVPVPGVWLGAVARATRRMHLGPLVYLLPLYSPLRLIEEICILDHLSGGRLEVGVGRGVSPFELMHHKIDHAESRDIFIDAFNCLTTGLQAESLTYTSKYYTYKNVPIPLRPLQAPYPPFWYGSSNATGSTWAGEQGLHFVTNGATTRAKANITAFKQAYAKRGSPASPRADFPGGIAVGISRQIVVADTDEAAHRIAASAFAHYHANLLYLWRLNIGDDLAARQNVPIAGTFEDALKEGTIIAGNPQTVRAEIEKQIAELGINYLLTYMMFGTMPLADALRSLQLFSTEIMPALAGK